MRGLPTVPEWSTVTFICEYFGQNPERFISSLEAYRLYQNWCYGGYSGSSVSPQARNEFDSLMQQVVGAKMAYVRMQGYTNRRWAYLGIVNKKSLFPHRASGKDIIDWPIGWPNTPQPKVLAQKTSEYIALTDETTEQYITAWYTRDSEQVVLVKDVYAHYAAWCHQENHQQVSAIAFGKQMLKAMAVTSHARYVSALKGTFRVYVGLAPRVAGTVPTYRTGETIADQYTTQLTCP